MINGINVEEIKKYNESLRAHKERASKIQAEIQFNTAEINRLCEELTKDLGVQVNPENLEQIYNERVEKINNTLQTGKEILKRIEEEEKEQQREAQGEEAPPMDFGSATQEPLFTAQESDSLIKPMFGGIEI